MAEEPEQPRDPIPSELAQRDEAFAGLVEEFVGGLDKRLQEISDAMDTRDFNLLRVLAHQLKGSAGGYGYPAITTKAAEIELHAIGRELEAIEADVGRLQDLVARVVVRF